MASGGGGRARVWLAFALGVGCTGACGGRVGENGGLPSGPSPSSAGTTPPVDAGATGAPAGMDAAEDGGATDAGSTAPEAAASCTTDDIDLVARSAQGTYELEAFHPSTGQTTALGPLDCNPAAPSGSEPVVGLAVDRSGHLYADYGWNDVFPVVATSTGFACQTPGLQPVSRSTQLLEPLGIAFASRPGQPETLYGTFLAPLSGPQGDTGSFLGTIDLQSGAVTVLLNGNGVGGLTGTSDGRVFSAANGILLELYPIAGKAPLSWSYGAPFDALGLYMASYQAPAVFWAGDFLFFSSGQVLRYRPADDTATVVATLPTADEIVAAAVSTCAPLQ